MKLADTKWSVVPLGSVVEEFKGGASLTADDFTDSGFPVLHKGTIQLGGRLDFERDGKVHTSEEFVAAHPNAVVDDRFVVATLRNLVRTGETLGFVAPVPAGRSYLLAQGAYGLRLNPTKLHPRYLAHLSNDWIFHKEILRRMVGTTQVHIRNGDFLAVEIPLPPLAEQRRIAEVLDRAEALRAKRRAALAQLDSLTQSLFLDLFGDPRTNVKGWPKSPIGSVISDMRRGAALEPDDFVESGFPILHKGAIKPNGGITLDSKKKTFAPLEYAKANPRSQVNREFTAVTLRDLVPTGPSIGLAVDLRHGPFDEYLLAQGAYGFRLDPNRLNPEFFVALSNNPNFRHVFRQNAVGSTQIHIRTPIYLAIQIPLPPIELQRQFARQVSVAEKLKSTSCRSLAELDALFATLQHRAFKGEL
ncbi:hypothetical protein GC207_14910 [bacterium]|nr:hypothetical protein [bacterium]